jgi:hypothetical protein
MELINIFAGSVGLISVIHLVSGATKQLAARGPRKKLQAAELTDSWYCFFKMSALHGDAWRPSVADDNKRPVVQSQIRSNRKQPIRQQPRLHV